MSKKGRKPVTNKNLNVQKEKLIPPIYPVIDTDLARDNLENDIPAADLQELKE